jgi:hypothetical protein
LTSKRTVKQSQHPWYDVLHELEMEMLDPLVRGNARRLDELLRNDFVEFGSSGRVYHKKMLMDMLVHEQHAKVAIRDFAVKEISADAALITYRTVGSAGQEARRSSIWTRRAGRWQMVFHQGTRIPNSWAFRPGPSSI